MTQGWKLVVAGPAERALARLPEKTATAVVEFLLGALTDDPRRVGKPLERELTGLWVARRGAYRVVYDLDEAQRLIVVLRIDHRADIYRSR